MAIAESYTPMYVGATLPIWNWTFETDSGALINLSGAALTLYFYDPNTNQQVQGAGAWNITNASGGQAQYTLDITDTANPFEGFILVHITIGPGTYVVDPKPFEVKPLFFLAGESSSFV